VEDLYRTVRIQPFQESIAEALAAGRWAVADSVCLDEILLEGYSGEGFESMSCAPSASSAAYGVGSMWKTSVVTPSVSVQSIYLSATIIFAFALTRGPMPLSRSRRQDRTVVQMSRKEPD
jgi:hypothetical protein